MNISQKTLALWRKKNLELEQAICCGRELADYEVEDALYKSAISGRTTAQIFWLKNRKPAQWRDKPEEMDTLTENEDDPITQSLKELLLSELIEKTN